MAARTLVVALVCGALFLSSCAQPVPLAGETLVPARTPTAEPTGAPTATPVPCAQQLAELDALLTEWDDADKLASRTARIALSQPVANLQSIRRRLGPSVVPECARMLDALLGAYMDSKLSAYLTFMENSSDQGVRAKMQESVVLRDLADEALVRIRNDESVGLHQVEYRAGGVFWFGVTYTVTPLASTGPRYDVADPWTTTGLALSHQTVWLKVDNKMNKGGAFCEIWVDGQLVDHQTSEEPYGQQVCSYDIP